MIRRNTSPDLPKKVDAILTADWHLRESIPACRVDDFWEAQWKKVDYVAELQRQYDCQVWHAGDLFDHWKPSPALLSETIKHLPDEFCSVYGNHDLPQHSFELRHKCGIYTLYKAKALNIFRKDTATHWGFPIETYFQHKDRNIIITHIMTFKGEKPFPGCTDSPSHVLLHKHKEADLILTGHNHQSFTEQMDGRVLVNAGCLTRQESDQAEFTPRVWLWNAEQNRVWPVPLPYKKDVVTRPISTAKIEERNTRIEAFISKLQGEWDSSINFDKNLEKFLAANPQEEPILKIINKALFN